MKIAFLIAGSKNQIEIERWIWAGHIYHKFLHILYWQEMPLHSSASLMNKVVAALCMNVAAERFLSGESSAAPNNSPCASSEHSGATADSYRSKHAGFISNLMKGIWIKASAANHNGVLWSRPTLAAPRQNAGRSFRADYCWKAIK